MTQPLVHLSVPKYGRLRGSCQLGRAQFGAEPLEPRLSFSALFSPAPGPPINVGFTQSAGVGDFNGDGFPDVATANVFGGTGSLRILLGNGHGGLVPAPGPAASIAYGNSMAVGDFTGSGVTDVALADDSNGIAANGTVSAYLGNGNGTFALAPGSPIAVGEFPVNIAAGSFTGDGRSDLVVANLISQSVSVLLSNGNGTFTPAPGSPFSVPGGPISLALGDFNGDGKLDIAVALQRQGSAAVEVFLGNGNGTFSLPGRLTTFPGGDVRSIAAGDFNGDGRLDLAAAESAGVYTLLNNGDGTFTPAPASPTRVGTSTVHSIVAADLTGSGTQDLVVGNDGNVAVLLGNGNGTFKEAPGSPYHGGLVAVGDFGGTSELDLVVSKSNNSVSVLLNTTPPLATGPLTVAASARLPTAIVGGIRIKRAATVTVSAPAGKAVKGRVYVTLHASSSTSLSGATELAPPIAEALTLKAGASKVLRIPLSSFPSDLQGNYYVIAAVQTQDGTITAVAGPPVAVVKPVMNVLASKVVASPVAVAPGKRLSLGLTLQNTGNVAATGTAGLTVSLSASPSGADSTVVATVPLRVKLKAGQSKPFRVKFRVPIGTAAGSYYAVASLAVSALGDPVAADGIAVSGMPITVSS